MTEASNTAALESRIDRIASEVSGLKSNVSALERRISAVESESKERDRTLDRRIDELTHHIEQLMKQLQRDLQELVTAVREEGKDSRQVGRELVQSSHAVRKAVEHGESNVCSAVEKGSGEVCGSLDRGHTALGALLTTSEQTTRVGLRRVANGLAVGEVMQAVAEGSQSETVIQRAIKEIQDRLLQAQEAVEKKQQEFDLHFERISHGFHSQMNVIGEHVVRISDRIMPVLDDLHVDEHDYNIATQMIRESQGLITNLRTDRLREAVERIDMSNLRRFQELRAHLRDFVNDPKFLRIEYAPDREIQASPSYGLPVVVVRLARAGEGSDENGGTRVCCLEANALTCDKLPEHPKAFSEITQSIQSLAERLEPQRDLDDSELSGIRAGLLNLVNAGMLDAGDHALIEEHLVTHPLKHLEG